MSNDAKGHGKFREIQLDNKFGITDQYVISEAEALLTTLATAEGVPTGKFDLAHLKSIHKHLLGDLYDWAGELRTTSITVGGAAKLSPSSPALVESDTERLLKTMNSERFDTMNRLEFAEKMATYYTRLYAISPFPDGNARTTRAFIDAAAGANDMQIDWGKFPADGFNRAVEDALRGNQNKLKELMRHMTAPLDLFDMHGIEGIKKRSAEIIQSAGLRQDLLPSDQMTSAADITKLARHAKLEILRSLESYANGSGDKLQRDWDQTSIHHSQANTYDRSRGSEVLKDVLANMEGGSDRGLRGPRPG